MKKYLTTISLLGALTSLLLVNLVSGSEVTGTLNTGGSVGAQTGIDGTVIAVPTASPAAGTYTSAQSVTLTTTGATSIHYTTDGTTPTCTTGTTYSSAISVGSSMTIKALSCYPNSNASTVGSFAYTINISSGGSSGGGGGGSYIPASTSTTATSTTATSTTSTSTTSTSTTTTGGGTPSSVSAKQALLNSLIAQVAQLQALLHQMQGGGGGAPEAGTPYVFKRNLGIGMVGEDVKQLQIYLNENGFAVAKSGPGSAGKETTKFGFATSAALARFQKSVKISPASGYFGPLTRAYVNSHQ